MCKASQNCTRFDGGVQLLQAQVDLVVHLPPPVLVLREGVPVCAVRLADLPQQQSVRLSCVVDCMQVAVLDPARRVRDMP